MKTKLLLLMVIGMMAIGSTSMVAQSTGDELRFISQQNGSTIALSSLASHQTIEYSADGLTWTNMNAESTISLNKGDSVYVRGVLTDSNTSEDFTQFTMSGSIAAKGNINYLWDYENIDSPLKEYCGLNLFKDCASLGTPPSLPATTLASNCYQGMFHGCTALTTVPELPATTLEQYCYTRMFQECTSLTSVSTLPAIKLANYCYWRMFRGCSSLTSAPALPATTLTTYCYNQMFMQTAITTAPELPANTLGDYSYYQMFYGCNQLNHIKCLATDISATGCTQGWVNGVATSGTFVKNSQMTSWANGNNGIPTAWTVSDADNSTYKIGELYYVLNAKNQTAKVTYCRSQYDSCFNEYSGSIVIPASVSYNMRTYNVTSIGNSAFSGCTGLTSIEIPNSVTSVEEGAFDGCSSLATVIINSNAIVSKNYTNSRSLKDIFGEQISKFIIGDSVTSIGDYAFKRFRSLISIEIPNRVNNIGSKAFDGCSSLDTVIINSNTIVSKTYTSDSNLKNIFGAQVLIFIIGDSITGIGDYAFNGCDVLTSVTIGNSVTSIGKYAFYNCTGLTSVTIGNSVTSIGNSAFNNCSIDEIHYAGTIYEWIKKSWAVNRVSQGYVLYIGDEIVTNLVIPDNITSIENSAFFNCTGLTSVTIPNSVTSIDYYAFVNCTGLTSVTIPNSVTKIGIKAFMGCTGLTSIEIPNSVTSIGENAFRNCTNLDTVTLKSKAIVEKNYYLPYNLINFFGKQVKAYFIGDNVTSIGSNAFNGCTGLISVTIPNSVTSIGQGAFSECTALTSVTIPNSVTSIEVGVFGNCMSLTSLTIPNSVTNISSDAFLYCTSLISIIIPDSVTYIGHQAFMGCSSLTYVTSEATTPPTLGNDVFKEVSNYSIYVPCNTLDVYKRAWSSYSSRIQYKPLEFSIIGKVNIEEAGSVQLPQKSCENNIIAIPNYGYHFVQWSDGNTDNPRSIILTQDTLFIAEFAINQYTITISCNSQQGLVTGESGTFDYGTELTYRANANEGYNFVRWSDGVKDNPRTIVLTRDTTLTALFDINTYLVQFFGLNDELLDSQFVEHGAAAIAPEAPIVDHYDFVGWDKEFTNIISNLDVFAIYQKNTEDVENVNVDALPYKVMIDGRILILRGDKIYTLQGQEVK